MAIIAQVQSHTPSMAIALLGIALPHTCRHSLYCLLHCPLLRPPLKLRLPKPPLNLILIPLLKDLLKVNSITHLEPELLIHKAHLLLYPQGCLLGLHPGASRR
jgi:hypothetical protein